MGALARDNTWRWLSGGLAVLSPEQLADAQASFDTWLRRYNRFTIGNVPVNSASDFVAVVQAASSRPCGLEGYTPGADMSPTAAQDETSSADAAVTALTDSLAEFLHAYGEFDRQCQRIKVDPVLFPSLFQSEESLLLCRAAWHLSAACMASAEAIKKVGGKLTGSPLKHPFLVGFTRRYVEAMLLPSSTPTSEPPPCPFRADPLLMDLSAQAVVVDWVSEHAESEDAFRWAREREGIDTAAKAAMMRWLDGIGELEALSAEAEERGQALSATGYALNTTQRNDLRCLRQEMGAFLSAKHEVAKQRAVIRKLTAGADQEAVALERKVLARLEEMRDHHKSRAAFHWVQSFHFEPEAQAEAAMLSPRLVSVAKQEIEGDVTQSSGEVGVFLAERSVRERQALEAMVQASQALAATSEAKAQKHPAAMTGVASSLVGRIVSAARALGADLLGDMRAVLPALAGQAARLVDATKPTPIEQLQKKVNDWRVDGLAVADKRMRRAADRPAVISARQTMVGYARAVTEDSGLMAKVRKADPACAAWIERVGGKSSNGDARTAATVPTEAAEMAASSGFGIR